LRSRAGTRGAQPRDGNGVSETTSRAKRRKPRSGIGPERRRTPSPPRTLAAVSSTCRSVTAAAWRASASFARRASSRSAAATSAAAITLATRIAPTSAGARIRRERAVSLIPPRCQMSDSGPAHPRLIAHREKTDAAG
jgi:hypothetical protein